ncbi:hypothetical protein AXG93_4703s1000 [Marchantia polymorpha subsp. ruderalis]|uniref:Uncharacterized protein n=1 Tax=Marchantia polymorpha subsp. ruderalis TaxID=1480154 RepID=A0A176VPL3_MARPO|nr:hypothetical protein AXG93_4703s1000 [Marchantia polymorpha subsp. ruderalis]
MVAHRSREAIEETRRLGKFGIGRKSWSIAQKMMTTLTLIVRVLRLDLWNEHYKEIVFTGRASFGLPPDNTLEMKVKARQLILQANNSTESRATASQGRPNSKAKVELNVEIMARSLNYPEAFRVAFNAELRRVDELTGALERKEQVEKQKWFQLRYQERRSTAMIACSVSGQRQLARKLDEFLTSFVRGNVELGVGADGRFAKVRFRSKVR